MLISLFERSGEQQKNNDKAKNKNWVSPVLKWIPYDTAYCLKTPKPSGAVSIFALYGSFPFTS